MQCQIQQQCNDQLTNRNTSITQNSILDLSETNQISPISSQVTPEEMEAYKMKRVHHEDPMNGSLFKKC